MATVNCLVTNILQYILFVFQRWMKVCLERHEGDRIFIFGWTIPIRVYCKWLVHPKMKIQSLITHPHVVPNRPCLGFDHVVALQSMEGQKALGFNQKYHQKYIYSFIKTFQKWCGILPNTSPQHSPGIIEYHARSPAKTRSSSMPVKNVACYCDI